jgi:membrane protein
MLRTFRIPLSWSDLTKRTVSETVDDNGLGLAAQLAYYFLLALVPAIVFVAALASYFPARVIDTLLATLAPVAPTEVLTILRDQLSALAEGQDTGLLTFGLAMALWSSSAAMTSLTDAINRAYDLEDTRPWWRIRLVGMGLTIFLAVFVLGAVAIVMAGPSLIDALVGRWGGTAALATMWKWLQWPIAAVLIAFSIGVIYYVSPDADQDWEWVTPGAALATVLWAVASLAFKIYLTHFADYNATYGSLGGVIVLMLWLYLTGLALVVGAEMNSEIEHASPFGKQPGEKTAAGRRVIGAAAARAFAQRRQPVPAPAPAHSSASPESWSVATYGVVAFALVRSLARRISGRT